MIDASPVPGVIPFRRPPGGSRPQVFCPHCEEWHDAACPSPEEIWGTVGPDGQRVGGLVNEPRAVAVRRLVAPDAVAVRGLDERVIETDEHELPLRGLGE